MQGLWSLPASLLLWSVQGAELSGSQLPAAMTLTPGSLYLYKKGSSRPTQLAPATGRHCQFLLTGTLHGLNSDGLTKDSLESVGLLLS